MKVKVYWHLWLTGRWRPIVAEQLAILHASGLYAAASEISLSVIGTSEEQAKADFLLSSSPKCKVRVRGEQSSAYEFPALRILHADSKQDQSECAICYFHSKGVRYENDRASVWRDILHDGVLLPWRKHLAHLENFDLSGQNYLPATPGKFPAHFSGNFWFARSSYVAALPDIDQLDLSDRYNAEWWVCFNEPRVFAFPFRQSPQPF